MSMKIDARGLPCPQPLMLARKAAETGRWHEIRVTVDNGAARENLLKYAGFAGLSAEVASEPGGIETVVFTGAEGGLISPAGGSGAGTAGAAAAGMSGEAPVSVGADRQPVSTSPDTIFIRTETLGPGNPELGRLLMRGFLYALAEREKKPRKIILMNDGVRLAVEGAETLESLNRLTAAGTTLLVCGTCLDYLGLKESLRAGIISNMYDITESFLESSGVLTV